MSKITTEAIEAAIGCAAALGALKRAWGKPNADLDAASGALKSFATGLISDLSDGRCSDGSADAAAAPRTAKRQPRTPAAAQTKKPKRQKKAAAPAANQKP